MWILCRRKLSGVRCGIAPVRTRRRDNSYAPHTAGWFYYKRQSGIPADGVPQGKVKGGYAVSVLQKLRDLILNIITGHITDLVSFHMLFRGEAFDRIHTALNVHASRVGTDLDPLLPGFPWW